MMRWILLIFLLGACDQVPPQDSRTIKLTLLKNTQDVAKACHDQGLLEDFGCAKVSGTNCEIVALDVRTGYDDRDRLATWGHELRHCFRGPIHD